MCKQRLLTIAIPFLLAVIFARCGSSSDSDNSCQVYCENDEHIIDALIRTTKENDENCGNYYLHHRGIDKYGREIWEKSGYYILTDAQWEELRKYENSHYYLQEEQAPTWHELP